MTENLNFNGEVCKWWAPFNGATGKFAIIKNHQILQYYLSNENKTILKTKFS